MSGSGAFPTTTMLALNQNKNNQPDQVLLNTTKIENPKSCFTSTTYTTTGSNFQMPLHYPRYKKSDYETMPVWKLDCLLRQYGLPVIGDVNYKRKFAMGAFLWPSQNT
ncbi:unnamed protein product [Withania somnifera]